MSRIRTSNQPGGWLDLGPTGCRTKPAASIHGALVVGGPVTGPVMGFFGKGHNKTPDEVEDARNRFHPHGKGRAA